MIPSIWVSLYPTALKKKIITSGNGLDESNLGKALFLRNHRPVGAIEEPLMAVGEVLLEGFHAFDDLPARAGLEDLAKRADVGIGICLGRTSNNFSYRPFPTFIDVVYGASILHGFVEMAEMSQIDAQPWKRIWLENIGPECRICTILIIAVWPEAVAGMGHDWCIVRAAPRVKFCKSGVELATDL